MIELRHLHHFLAVAAHPTLQAAADALHLTQPALTKSIARFEDELGAALFDRRGRRLVLTELGERVRDRGTAVLGHVRKLEEEVGLWRDGALGDVALGAGPLAELEVLPPALSAFVRAHPRVRVSIHSGHTAALIPRLLAGELHFVVSDQELASARDDLEIRPLPTGGIAMAVRRGHPLSRRRRRRFGLGDLGPYPLASASLAPRFARWAEERLASAGLEPPGLVCDNYELLARTAEQTDCIVFGPRALLDGYVDAGRLALLPFELEGPRTQPSLIAVAGRPLSPAAERFAALLLEAPLPGQATKTRAMGPGRVAT